MFSASGFALSYAVNMFILMILYDFYSVGSDRIENTSFNSSYIVARVSFVAVCSETLPTGVQFLVPRYSSLSSAMSQIICQEMFRNIILALCYMKWGELNPSICMYVTTTISLPQFSWFRICLWMLNISRIFPLQFPVVLSERKWGPAGLLCFWLHSPLFHIYILSRVWLKYRIF
jgi:hypothetical protein